MIGVLIRRWPCEDRGTENILGRQWIGFMHLQASECQRLPTNHQEQDSLAGFRGTEPCYHLDLGLNPPWTVRQYIVIV